MRCELPSSPTQVLIAGLLEIGGLIAMRIVPIARNVGTANVTEWAKLALSDLRARVLRVTRIRLDDQDRPFALEKVILVLERFPGLEGDSGTIADIGELALQYGLLLARTTERISLVPAPADVGAQLGLAMGADVLKLDRVVETADGIPVEWRTTFSRAQ